MDLITALIASVDHLQKRKILLVGPNRCKTVERAAIAIGAKASDVPYTISHVVQCVEDLIN